MTTLILFKERQSSKNKIYKPYLYYLSLTIWYI